MWASQTQPVADATSVRTVRPTTRSISTQAVNNGLGMDAKGTSVAAARGDVLLVSSVRAERNLPRALQRGNRAPGPLNQVPGVVSKFDDVSVVCAVDLPGRRVEIQLPRALFTQDLKYGMPFSLQMVEENGLRRPIVTARPLDHAKSERPIQNVRAILEKLKK